MADAKPAAAEEPKDDYIKPVKRPDVGEFDNKIEAATKEKDKLDRQLNSVQQKISEKRSSAQAVQQKIAVERKKLAPLRSVKNQLRDERKKLYDRKDAANERILKKKAVAQKMKDDLRYTNLNQIDDEIRKLEYEQKTTSFGTLIEEKAVIKDIEKLKHMRRDVKKYSDAYKAAKEDESMTKELRGQIAEASKRLSASEKKLDSMSGVMKELMKQAADAKNLSPDFKEQGQIRDKLSVVRDTLNKLNTEKRTLMKEYNEYSAKMRQKKFEASKLERAEWNAQRDQQRKDAEEEEAKQKPWMAEIGACDSMISYLKDMLPKSYKPEKRMDDGQAYTRDEFVKEYGGLQEWNKADVEGEKAKSATMTLSDGTVITPMAKRTGNDMIMCGGNRHKQKRNRKKKKAKPVRHTPDSLFTFSLLKINPPREVTDIPGAIEELTDKRAYYDTLPRAVKKSKAPKKSAAKPAKAAETKKADAPAAAPAAVSQVAPPAVEVKLLEAVDGEYNMYITYCDDAALGKKAPLLEGLEICQGGPIPAYAKGKTTVVYFWAKFIKDNAYAPLIGLDHLMKKLAGTLQVVAIGIDPKKSDVERHISKATKNTTDAGNKQWTGGKTDLTLAWEDSTPANGGPKVKKAFHEFTGLDSFMCPQAFIVDENGVIVWRQAFSRNTTPYATSRFEQQLMSVMGGKSLYSFGANPQEEGELSDLDIDGDEAPDVFAAAETADGAW